MRWRQSRTRPFRNRGVAISAIDPKFAGVVAMTKWHRLRAWMNVRPGHPIRAGKTDGERHTADGERGRADQKQA